MRTEIHHAQKSALIMYLANRNGIELLKKGNAVTIQLGRCLTLWVDSKNACLISTNKIGRISTKIMKIFATDRPSFQS